MPHLRWVQKQGDGHCLTAEKCGQQTSEIVWVDKFSVTRGFFQGQAKLVRPSWSGWDMSIRLRQEHQTDTRASGQAGQTKLVRLTHEHQTETSHQTDTSASNWHKSIRPSWSGQAGQAKLVRLAQGQAKLVTLLTLLTQDQARSGQAGHTAHTAHTRSGQARPD